MYSAEMFIHTGESMAEKTVKTWVPKVVRLGAQIVITRISRSTWGILHNDFTKNLGT